MTMKIVSIKKVSFFIVPLITLLGIYSLTMNKPSLSSFKQNSVHAASLAGAETSMNFKIVDEKTIMINNIPSIVKKEYIKSLSSTEVPPGAPSGDYLMLETSAYIFAMKQSGGNTYIGLVKDLINEGEGHIWWKI
ncbi:hypothetical protein KAF86_10145 [Klebsiella pneumoniae]|uniref:Uncharacterized protein n=10 Tax=Enterobacteriaceae TaxID=543 RepID=A0A2N4Z7C8_KLEVA|nr:MULTISPECIES: hypothetical protein [Enterobacteriaceae]EFH8091675.1 hypothetical protein [Escherichia coli]MDU7379796.1 hypothetical protein [Enterobacteriaceae bacterium]HCA9797986.1 hypothetical protein [Klebsiella variicola subsp. variicola]HCI7397322.1 hypothetical protein [Klebsiella pneumoniae subsp. pneumoniae Kp001]HCM6828289.1 hypothetical protein [Klebsiella quasipneumoniae subsp. quasipneumoniae]